MSIASKALAIAATVMTLVAMGFGCPATAAPATAATTVTSATLHPSAAWILLDADTGTVLEASNDRTPLPPASVTKLLTALVAAAHLDPESNIAVSPNAQRMPAMKIGLKAGESWKFDQLMHSLLIISANDAAVALAEASGGSLGNFVQMREQAAQELGLQDHPILNDPAGLDDNEYSYDGGDRISARDLAIVARAALASPIIRPIVGEATYDFVDPNGKAHHLVNHNKMLPGLGRSYPGDIGLKTGYTQRSRNTYVGAATRNGRTMLVVMMGTDEIYDQATKLLDTGFATPVSAELPTADHVPLNNLHSQLAGQEQVKQATPRVRMVADHSNSMVIAVSGAGLVVVAILAMAFRAREVRVREVREVRDLSAIRKVSAMRRPALARIVQVHEVQAHDVSVHEYESRLH